MERSVIYYCLIRCSKKSANITTNIEENIVDSDIINNTGRHFPTYIAQFMCACFCHIAVCFFTVIVDTLQ